MKDVMLYSPAFAGSVSNCLVEELPLRGYRERGLSKRSRHSLEHHSRTRMHPRDHPKRWISCALPELVLGANPCAANPLSPEDVAAAKRNLARFRKGR